MPGMNLRFVKGLRSGIWTEKVTVSLFYPVRDFCIDGGQTSVFQQNNCINLTQMSP